MVIFLSYVSLPEGVSGNVYIGTSIFGQKWPQATAVSLWLLPPIAPISWTMPCCDLEPSTIHEFLEGKWA